MSFTMGIILDTGGGEKRKAMKSLPFRIFFSDLKNGKETSAKNN